MRDERPSSIHDIDSAPEAPDTFPVFHNITPNNSNTSPLRPYSPLSILNRTRAHSFEGLDHIRASRQRFDGQDKLDQKGESSDGSYNSNAGRRNRDLSFSPLNLIRRSLSNSQSESDQFSNESRKRNDSDLDRLDQISESSGANRVIKMLQRNGSDEQWAEDVEEDDDEDLTYIDNERRELSNVVKYVCGCIPLPSFCKYQSKWTRRVATSLVRNAPCFWFCSRKLETGATDRSILYRLNVLCAIFALFEILLAATAVFMLYWPVDRNYARNNKELNSLIVPNLWNINGFAFLYGIVACAVFILKICTLPIIREVNLKGAISYYWTLTWFLPLQIFATVGLFDKFNTIEVWIRHWWAVPSMALYRKLFCMNDTFDEQCLVPINNETEWCEKNYNNSTDCESIRNEAQEKMILFSKIYFNFFFVCGIISIMLLILTRSVLSGIITRPIIQRSRDLVLPCWLAFPVVACFAIALSVYVVPYFQPKNLPELNHEAQLLAVWYTVCGCLFLLSALLAWFNGSLKILNAQDKRNKHISIICFIILNAANLMIIGFVLAITFLFTFNIIQHNIDNRGKVACLLDDGVSCTCCEPDQCPDDICEEWTVEEVESVVETISKSSLTIGIILFLYAIGTLHYGFHMKNELSMYQIDYV